MLDIVILDAGRLVTSGHRKANAQATPHSCAWGYVSRFIVNDVSSILISFDLPIIINVSLLMFSV
jgi:hypothetical protein